MFELAVLAALRDRGISIRIDGDQLRCKFPPGVDPSDFIEPIRDHKPGLLALLEAESRATRLSYVRPPVGTWPLELKQMWGDLANRFADEGLPWPEDERKAYAVVLAETHDNNRDAA